MKNLLILIGAALALVSAHAEEQAQYDLRIDGITCPFCVATSEQALREIDGIELISSNLETGIISVCGASSLSLDETQLTKLFRNKGFTYRGLTQANVCSIDETVDEHTNDHTNNDSEE